MEISRDLLEKVFKEHMNNVPDIEFITCDGSITTKIFYLYKQYPVFNMMYCDDWDGKLEIDVTDIGITSEAMKWIIEWFEVGKPDYSKFIESDHKVPILKFLDKFEVMTFVTDLLKASQNQKLSRLGNMCSMIYNYHIANLCDYKEYDLLMSKFRSVGFGGRCMLIIDSMKNIYKRPDIDDIIYRDFCTVGITKSRAGVCIKSDHKIIIDTNLVTKNLLSFVRDYNPKEDNNYVIGALFDGKILNLTYEEREFAESLGWPCITKEILKEGINIDGIIDGTYTEAGCGIFLCEGTGSIAIGTGSSISAGTGSISIGRSSTCTCDPFEETCAICE